MPFHHINAGMGKFIAGAEPLPARHRVIDAAGNQVLYLLCCDTETGFVQRYDVSDGDYPRWQVDENGRSKILAEIRPAPLVLQPIPEGETYIRLRDPIIVGAA